MQTFLFVSQVFLELSQQENGFQKILTCHKPILILTKQMMFKKLRIDNFLHIFTDIFIFMSCMTRACNVVVVTMNASQLCGRLLSNFLDIHFLAYQNRLKCALISSMKCEQFGFFFSPEVLSKFSCCTKLMNLLCQKTIARKFQSTCIHILTFWKSFMFSFATLFILLCPSLVDFYCSPRQRCM